MIDFSNINSILTFLLLIGGIFAGTVAIFFIIKSQLVKVLQLELNAYKDKVERLQTDLDELVRNLGIIKTENLGLITERDYLKNLIITAISSKKDIHKELMDEIKLSDDKTRIYKK